MNPRRASALVGVCRWHTERVAHPVTVDSEGRLFGVLLDDGEQSSAALLELAQPEARLATAPPGAGTLLVLSLLVLV